MTYTLVVGMHGSLPEHIVNELDSVEEATDSLYEYLQEMCESELTDFAETEMGELEAGDTLPIHAGLFVNSDEAPYPDKDTSIWYAQITEDESDEDFEYEEDYGDD